MPYTKHVWVDESVEFPKRYTLTNVSGDTYDLERETGLVASSDPITALKLNNMENTISELDLLANKINTYRLGVDSNGVYTEIQLKRADGTLLKKSVLTGGTSPKYTTRTETYYALDGTTVLSTSVYTLTYTGDNLVSEVLI